MDDAPRRRLVSYLGVDGTRRPMPPPNPRNRRLLRAGLAAFLVLNVLTRSWVFVLLSVLWLVLILVREVIDRRTP